MPARAVEPTHEPSDRASSALVQAHPGEACWQCAYAEQRCGGWFPCERCEEVGVACDWPAVPQDQLEFFAEPMHLGYGAPGSARLRGERTRDAGATRFEWESAVQQSEELRLLPNSRYPPVSLAPPSVASTTAFFDNGKRNPKASSEEAVLLRQANAALAPTRVHPTLLLNSLLRFDPVRANPGGPALADRNRGNCLALLNAISRPTGPVPMQGTSAAFWMTGNSEGLATSVCGGMFGRHVSAKERRTGGNQSEAADSTSYRASSGEEVVHHFEPLPPFSPVLPVPLLECQDPILQLQIAPIGRAAQGLLAVRSWTSLTLHHLDFSRGFPEDKQCPWIVSSYGYRGRDLGRRAIADVALGGVYGGQRGSGLIVDEYGSLFGFGLSGDAWSAGRPEMFRLRKSRRAAGGSAHVTWGGSRGLDAVVGFDDEVLVYDLRSPKASLTLVDSTLLKATLPPLLSNTSMPIITSLTTPNPWSPLHSTLQATATPTPIHSICTTHDIVWLDERMPGKDVMRWTHGRLGRGGRGVDHTLTLMSIPSAKGESDGIESISRLALSSRIHSHLAIYTYSSSAHAPVRSLLDPYSLESPVKDKSWTRAGLSIVPTHLQPAEGASPDDAASLGWTILESGANGDLHSRFVSLAGEDVEHQEPPAMPIRYRRELPQAMAESERERTAFELKDEISDGELLRVLDMRIAYRAVVGEHATADSVVPTAVAGREGMDARRVGETETTLRAMIEVQQSEGSIDPGSLTAHDLLTFSTASMITPLPRTPTFFSPSAPSIHDLAVSDVADVLGALSDTLEQAAPWSMLPFQARPDTPQFCSLIAPDITTDWTCFSENVERIKTRYQTTGTDKIHAVASAACEQVALDLALASRIYSTRPMLPPPMRSDAVNETLPLDQPLPPIHFSWFRPTLSSERANQKEETILGKGTRKRRHQRPSLELPGAQSILGEWHLGSDPDSFGWSNPYLEENKKSATVAPSQAESSLHNGRKRAREHELREDPPSSSQVVFGSSTQSSLSDRRINRIEEGDESPHDSLRVPSGSRHARPSRRSDNFSASQPAFGAAPDSSQSQTQSLPNMFGAASQVLPGTFGGRVEPKKIKKKRVSGF